MNNLLSNFLTALNRACLAHPEQRVGQVISNALDNDPALFHLTDERAIEKLYAYARKDYSQCSG